MVLEMEPRPLEALINLDESGWKMVHEWLLKAVVSVEVLPASLADREQALMQTQVTTRSPIGAIVYECAGLLIDHGWLRILAAGGHPRFTRSLPGWNVGRANGFYLVADDVMGGFFAINGGGLGSDHGSVYYFAPDRLEWETTKLSYSQFIAWCVTDKLDQYYQDLRWPGWENEVESTSADQCVNIYPFLFAKGPPLADRFRRPVPVHETFSLLGPGGDIIKQL